VAPQDLEAEEKVWQYISSQTNASEMDSHYDAWTNEWMNAIEDPELEKQMVSSLDGVKDLVFDLKDLEYISSAGLRVLLTAMQIMDDQDTMKVINVCDTVMSVFEVTGFVEDLKIE